MKYVFWIIATLFLISSSFCCTQHQSSNKNLIRNFIKKIIDDGQDVSFAKLKNEQYFTLSDEYKGLEDKAEADSTYTLVLKELTKNIKEKCGTSLKVLEILTVEESQTQKNYNEDLVIPENGQAYIIYCDNKVINRFLLMGGRIAAYSTLSKGETKLFMRF